MHFKTSRFTIQQWIGLSDPMDRTNRTVLRISVRSKSLVCIHLGEEQDQVKTGGLLLLVIGST